MNVARTWREAFDAVLQDRASAERLKECSIREQLTEWTTALTEVCVRACEAMGWRASAKGHKLELLPEARHEYLGMDLMAFAPEEGQTTWRFPTAVMELENVLRDSRIGYSLWKVLCVRADLRVVFCYRSNRRQAADLVRYLRDEVVQAMSIRDRTDLSGETLVVIGCREDAESFPHGFFKWWRLETNTGQLRLMET
ncbi:MAG: hypothetical protein NTV86_04955 [Planctomycetota bacterium]|nr:hypothetical protein [Planctomycetota bacterium]